MNILQKDVQTDSQKMEENSVLRWGGLAGMLSGIFLILAFVIVIAGPVGMEPADPEAMVMRFPNVRAARTLENGVYLVALILGITFFLAPYQALRGKTLAPALIGSVLGIVGLVVLAAGALPHAATGPLSDLYHAPGATLEEQATLVLLWQATQSIFEALLVVGLVFLPIGFLALGVAMLGAPAFGKGYGWASVVLGLVGLVAASLLLVEPASQVAAVGVLELIVFLLVMGWKVYSLSRAA